MTRANHRPGPAAPIESQTTAHKPMWSRPASAMLLLPGLALCVAVAALATLGGQLAPVIGAPVIGIVIGVAGRLAFGEHAVLNPGVGAAKGFVLQLAVVVLGSQLSLAEVARIGYTSLPVMIGTLVACLAVAYVVGRRLGIDGQLRCLIGVGTAICGASAIAAVSPVIRARSNQIAYAISTIFLFNVAAVLVFPPLGHTLGMSQTDFGLFAGTAVNDTSSVVATASSYGHSAENHAVVVKLVRTLMIIPICVGLAALARYRGARAADGAPTRSINPIKLIPWFLVGFLLVAGANSASLIPAGSHAVLSKISLFLITVALSGIGLSTNLAELRRTGLRPVALGFILWLTVAVTSIALAQIPA